MDSGISAKHGSCVPCESDSCEVAAGRRAHLSVLLLTDGATQPMGMVITTWASG